MFLLAHAGHWLIGMAYFAPVIGFLFWLGFVQIRDRRKGDDE
jgi:hypothetical protein